MSAKHTPGPWSFSTMPQPNGCPIIGTRGRMVAMLAHSVNHTEQKEEALANARLIAAAPDLLYALKQAAVMLAHVGGCQDTLDRANAAIAKAEGK